MNLFASPLLLYLSKDSDTESVLYHFIDQVIIHLNNVLALVSKLRCPVHWRSGLDDFRLEFSALLVDPLILALDFMSQLLGNVLGLSQLHSKLHLLSNDIVQTVVLEKIEGLSSGIVREFDANRIVHFPLYNSFLVNDGRFIVLCLY